MDDTVAQITDHIESRRKELRSNLEELGENVRSAVDWRRKYRADPGTFLAVALGGGFVIGSMIVGSRGQGLDRTRPQEAPALPRTRNDRGRHILHAWDKIQGALVGVVASKVASSLAEVVPGFKEQLAACEDDTRASNRASGSQ